MKCRYQRRPNKEGNNYHENLKSYFISTSFRSRLINFVINMMRFELETSSNIQKKSRTKPTTVGEVGLYSEYHSFNKNTRVKGFCFYMKVYIFFSPSSDINTFTSCNYFCLDLSSFTYSSVSFNAFP